MNIGQIMDMVIVCFFLFGIIRGWFVGLAVKVGHLIALIAAMISAHLAASVSKSILSEKVILPFLEEKTGGLTKIMQVLDKGAAFLADQIAYDLVFTVVFFIALLIFNHLVHILKIVDRIPVVGTLNKFGGALIGFVTEFILVYIICAVFFTFAPQSALDSIGLTQAVIRETSLLQFFIRQ